MLTRVNRDLRFSKDETPYKNYVLVVFNKIIHNQTKQDILFI
ncbi:MAG: DUF2461 family protein [Saprospiraceae bacterium]|nr:DUF2461 family protein [Saprospiraceae bacterium]